MMVSNLLINIFSFLIVLHLAFDSILEIWLHCWIFPLNLGSGEELTIADTLAIWQYG